jgi:putative Ca2+/H+ antiporter (TMEM165/GDT1 family)
MDFSVVAIVFGVIFISELPDKSMFASLVLGTKFPGLYVWAGAAAAFFVHVLIAVTAGQALALLPHRVVELVVAALFLAGALLLLFGNHSKENEIEAKKSEKLSGKNHGFFNVFGITFGVIFLGEWGDITQIATANYAARYHDPVSVAIGATLALWLAAALAIAIGKKLLNRIPARLLQRITAGLLLLFAALSVLSATQA